MATPEEVRFLKEQRRMHVEWEAWQDVNKEFKRLYQSVVFMQSRSQMTAKQLVQVWDGYHGFWRYGLVQKVGRKWIVVLTPTGLKFKVTQENVRPLVCEVK